MPDTADSKPDPIALLNRVAEWTEWMSLTASVASAPRLPGVYRVREGSTGPLVYIGMAGERAGGRTPKGLRGRLGVYLSGKALTSGLGEALADRAFADAAWLRSRLKQLEAGRPQRAREWGRATIDRVDPYVSWTTTVDRATAKALEARCIRCLEEHQLWNRRR
jgi:hypothetical protein